MSRRYTPFAAFTLAFACIAASSAWAQDKPTSSSLAPAGQGPGVNASSPATSGTSTRTRASVKAATRSAEHSGKLKPAGEAANPVSVDPSEAGKALTDTTSDRSRASVKAQTRAAASSGSLQPAGQAAQPVGQLPKQ